jgi:hypothetical protein
MESLLLIPLACALAMSALGFGTWAWAKLHNREG